ncbi:PKD domain-containing protein [Fulvivirga ligni]|uniref:PKD domain-containing protein n=1 Tax=Fulvivirga ligni TaxID=2904246 RepID=UPI001F30D136|nr:PKD domain-containing protein [Fulvivirga ligni]UII23012.1 gliding motility-associated C-terminal domain-containing protein [Fulvivirga ligni]
MKKNFYHIYSFLILSLFLSSLGISHAQTVVRPECDDLGENDVLYYASSFSGSNNYSLSLKGLFNASLTTTFEFNEDAYFIITDTEIHLKGTLTLLTNGNTQFPVGSQWFMDVRMNATSYNTPNIQLGQGTDLTDLWKYYEIDYNAFELYSVTTPSYIITLVSPPQPYFQYGTGANNKNISEFGGYSVLRWEQGSLGDDGHISIALDEQCVFTAPTAEIAGDLDLCPGASDNLTIELTGDAPWTVEYTKDNVAQTALVINTSPYQLPVTEAGQYVLTAVKDANDNSGSVSGTASVGIYTKPSIATLPSDISVCEGETASVTIEFTGEAPFTLIYNDGTTDVTVTSNDGADKVLALAAGTYNFISIEDKNCSSNINKAVAVNEGETLDLSINTPDMACFSDGLITLTAGSTGAAISPEGWSLVSGSGDLVDNGLSATYNPSLSDAEVTIAFAASNSCTASKKVEKTIKIYNPIASFEITPTPENGEYSPGIEYTFTPIDQSQASYAWNFGDGSVSSQKVATHTFSEKGEFFIGLEVFSTDDVCSAESNVKIAISVKNNIYVPNVFSPTSSNPENNVVKVYGQNILDDNFNFEIYNRWGSLVYSTKNLNEAQNQGWNGSSDGESKENNVFTYVVRGEFENGQTFEKTGTITLAK